MLVRLLLGDCVERMAAMAENSIGVVVCDPPYGLEFMGKDWDKLTVAGRSWEGGGSFTSPGIGERDIQWPSFSSNTRFGAANPTCEECGGRLRGAKKCSCPQPHDHWKPIGKRRKLPEDTPADLTGGGHISHIQAMQEWHAVWLAEVYRVLEPGGRIKTFGGTRVFHRLAAAMEDVGFTDIYLDSWSYGSGFPKSLNVGKALDKMAGAKRGTKRIEFTGNAVLRAGGQNTRPWMEEALKKGYHELPDDSPVTDAAQAWDGWGTALKPAWEPVLIGTKPCE